MTFESTESYETESYKVVVVDNSQPICDAFGFMISTLPDFRLCGQALNQTDALLLLQSSRPDVAVIDISLDTGDSIDLIKQIKLKDAGIRILVWSLHAESAYAETALSAGALGYITKDKAIDNLADALRCVARGETYVSSKRS